MPLAHGSAPEADLPADSIKDNLFLLEQQAARIAAFSLDSYFDCVNHKGFWAPKVQRVRDGPAIGDLSMLAALRTSSTRTTELAA